MRPATEADANAIAQVHVDAGKAAYRGVVPKPYLDQLHVEERAGVWKRILTGDLVADGIPRAQLMAATIGEFGRIGCTDAFLWVLEANTRRGLEPNGHALHAPQVVPPPRQTVTIPVPDGLRIVGDHWAGERSPVVLAHGGGQTRHSWGAAAEALASEGHQVLSIDLRGHGDSSWDGNGRYGMLDFVADHLAVIEWVGSEVHWVGASLGGSSGLAAVGAAADRFRSLVLVDITPRPAPAGVDRILTFMAQTSASGFADLDEAADAVAAYQPHRKRPDDPKGLAKNLRLGEDGRWRWHWDPAFVTSPLSMTKQKGRYEDAQAIARSMTVPTMLIRGRLSDLVTEAEAQAFLDLVPHAEYVDVADAAHMIAGDKNDAFMSAVIDFIRRQELQRL